jgi:hypothetical protein
MTTDLEKQFFDAFGIEPITHAVWDSTETKWKNFESWDEYPQITDRHYLELERICGYIVWYMGDSLIYEIDKKENKAVDFRHKYYAKEYSDRIYITGLTKKEALLKLCINSYIKEKIKHQVQELFKGE